MSSLRFRLQISQSSDFAQTVQIDNISGLSIAINQFVTLYNTTFSSSLSGDTIYWRVQEYSTTGEFLASEWSDYRSLTIAENTATEIQNAKIRIAKTPNNTNIDSVFWHIWGTVQRTSQKVLVRFTNALYSNVYGIQTPTQTFLNLQVDDVIVWDETDTTLFNGVTGGIFPQSYAQGYRITSGNTTTFNDDSVPNGIGFPTMYIDVQVGAVQVNLTGYSGTDVVPFTDGMDFSAIDANGNVVASATTGTDGQTTLNNLPIGNYSIVSLPKLNQTYQEAQYDLYTLPLSRTASITTSGELVTVNFEIDARTVGTPVQLPKPILISPLNEATNIPLTESFKWQRG